MIKYTTADIIKRAEQIADLNNSDFISDYEKLALLNENFQIMYQKLVNSGDKSYIKSGYVHSGESLPNDFYQLSAIYTANTKVQLPKINSTQTDGYELRNGRIYIRGYFRDCDIIMEYWPVCPDLYIKTVEAVEKDLYVGVCDPPRFVWPNSSSPSGYSVYDSDVEENFNLPSFSDLCTLDDIGIWPKGVLVSGTDPNDIDTSVMLYIPYGSTGYSTITTPVIYQDNLCTLGSDNKVYSVQNILMLDISSIDIKDNVKIIYADDHNVYQILNDNTYVCNNGDAVELPGELSIKAYQMNCIYGVVKSSVSANITKTGQLIKLTPTGYKLLYTKYPAINMYDAKHVLTGKSNYVWSDSGQKPVYYKESTMDDTLLSYPNSLYYTMLAYMLAISFKIKQNGDTTLLNQKYTEIENQFYDSLNNDSNETYLMKNVYIGRSRIW